LLDGAARGRVHLMTGVAGRERGHSRVERGPCGVECLADPLWCLVLSLAQPVPGALKIRREALADQAQVDMDQMPRLELGVAWQRMPQRRSQWAEVHDGIHSLFPRKAKSRLAHPVLHLLLQLLFGHARTQDGFDPLKDLLGGSDRGVDSLHLVRKLSTSDLACQRSGRRQSARVNSPLQKRLE